MRPSGHRWTRVAAAAEVPARFAASGARRSLPPSRSGRSGAALGDAVGAARRP